MELNRIGELSHIQRVWVLTQAAKLLAKTDRGKASSLVDAATAEAHRLDVQLARGFQGEAARANATIAIARSVLNDKQFRAPAP